MLWYKVWLETRTRFLLSLVGAVAICSYSVFHGDRLPEPGTNKSYYYFVLNSAEQLLILMWILAVTLLNMDSLLREKLSGTSSFTLALPVSRVHVMYTRVLVTFLEAMTLVIVPSLAMFVIGSIFGKSHSMYQAVFHFVLLVGGGMIFFALAVLSSSLIEGQYLAPTVSLGVSLTLLVSLNDGPMRYFSPFLCMVGDGYLSRDTGLLIGPIPWLRLFLFVSLSLALIALSLQLIRKRDF